jgi:hypothetical protein
MSQDVQDRLAQMIRECLADAHNDNDPHAQEWALDMLLSKAHDLKDETGLNLVPTKGRGFAHQHHRKVFARTLSAIARRTNPEVPSDGIKEDLLNGESVSTVHGWLQEACPLGDVEALSTLLSSLARQNDIRQPTLQPILRSYGLERQDSVTEQIEALLEIGVDPKALLIFFARPAEVEDRMYNVFAPDGTDFVDQAHEVYDIISDEELPTI